MRIMKKLLLLFLTMLLALPFGIKVNAQCTSGTLSNLIVTPSTCNNNGKVQVNYSIGGGATRAALSIYRDGQSNPTATTEVSTSSGTHTFEHLSPGKYTVKLLCFENLSQVYDQVDATVGASPSLNLSIINDKVTVSGICTNFTQGGVIEVADLTGVGGNPPYQVSVIKNDNTAYDDALSQYETPSSYPYQKPVAEFGKYQIRIKDACGAYVTVTRDIKALQPPLMLEWRPRKRCDGTTEGRFAFLYDGNSNNVLEPGPFQNPGIKLVVRADNQSGAVLYSGTFTGPPFIYTATPSHKYHVTTTNACGIEHQYTLDLDKNDFGELLNFKVKTFLSGCGSSQKMNILVDMATASYWAFPVTIEIKNSNGAIVSTQTINYPSSFTAKNLDPGNYSVTVRDACGFEMTKPAHQAQPVPLSLVGKPLLVKWACSSAGGQLTQTGTIQVLLLFDGIVDPDAKVTIVAGPSNVGVQGVFDPSNSMYGWTNMLPGDYTVQVEQCGTVHQFNFKVQSNELLKQSISSTGKSFCSGGGTITSTIVYNGRGRILVELLNEQNQVIESNATGTFINIPAGKYRTRLKIDYCGAYYIYDEHWIMLTDASTGPKILNIVGVVCEASDGTPQNTGSVYLNLSGVAPLTLIYKEQGNSTTTNVAIDPSLSSVGMTVEGLQANVTYEFVLKDGCGGNTTANVVVQTLTKALTVENTVHPCYNQPYTLSMPVYSQASYVWKNPSNAIVSTSREYPIANYTEAYDGTYTCEVSWNNCVRRIVQVKLDGAACGTPLKNYWIGTTDNVWNKEENWTGNKVPPTEADVEFATVDNNNGNPAVNDLHVPVDEPKVIGNLINNSDKDLVVTTNSQLTINGVVEDNNPVAGTIVVKSSKDNPAGTLLFANPGDNQNVGGTVEFYNQGYDCADCGMYRRSWQYFGIPVNESDFPYDHVDGNATVNQWVEPFNGDKWRPAPYAPDTKLQKFKGYQITNDVQAQPTGVYSFKGTLCVCDAFLNLTRTSGVNYSGANLIGNSYTAAIDIKQGIVFPQEVEQTVYLFNTGTRDQWRKLNGSTVSGFRAGQYLSVPKNTAGQDNLPDRIPSMHSFLVKMQNGASCTLQILYDKLLKNTTVNNGNGTQITWRSGNSGSANMPSLVMDVLGNESADRLWIFTDGGLSFGFDNGWDGRKLTEKGLSQLYAMSDIGNDKFQVAGVPELNNLLIGFDADKDGQYTLEFALSDHFAKGGVFLEDLSRGVTRRIVDGGSYSFDAKRGDSGARFRLSYDEEWVELAEVSVLVGTVGKRILITNNSEHACQANVYTTDGKLLIRLDVKPGSKSMTEPLIDGAYVVSLQSPATSSNVRKVVVN